MAKETREERVVRSMKDPLLECLIELKHLNVGPSKESDVESWCQTVLKSVLGFSASAGYQVRAQETRGKMRFDLVVSRASAPDQILLVVEVKKLGADLDKSDLRSGKTQLKEYLSNLGDVRWGILTNGFEWRLYDYKADAICITECDLREESEDGKVAEIDATAKGAEEAAWELVDLTSFYAEKKTWETMSLEAQAISPDSIAKAVLSSEIVKRIATQISGEHEYRVSIDQLTDKLTELLEKGLNEAVGNWNESRRAELDRYIRQQKKAAKKTRRRRKKAAIKGEVTESASVDATVSAKQAVVETPALKLIPGGKAGEEEKGPGLGPQAEGVDALVKKVG